MSWLPRGILGGRVKSRFHVVGLGGGCWDTVFVTLYA